MSQEEELARLEQFVDKLLAGFSQLREEKAMLELELEQRDELIAELRTEIASKNDERAEIHSRLNKLVEQIEDWELSLDEETEAQLNTGNAESEGVSAAEESTQEESYDFAAHGSNS